MKQSFKLLILSLILFTFGLIFLIKAGSNWFDSLMQIKNEKQDDKKLDWMYRLSAGLFLLSIIIFIVFLVLFFKGK